MPACTTAGQKPQVTLTGSKISLVCVACAAPLKDLNGFCITSCKTYFKQNPGCIGVDGTLVVANSCNRPIEDNNVCIIPAQTNIANGDSGLFGPCLSANYYVRDYVCIACTGASDYIDYQGVNCKTTCATTNFLFMDATHKICSCLLYTSPSPRDS